MANPAAGERRIERPGLLGSYDHHGDGGARDRTKPPDVDPPRHGRSATPDMTGKGAGTGLLWLASRFLSTSAAKVQSDVEPRYKLALARSTQDADAHAPTRR